MNHQKILDTMKAKNIKNKDLAEQTGIPLGTLNKIIYGISKDPSVNAVHKIAHTLGYKVDDFVDDNTTTHHDNESSILTEVESQILDMFRDLNDEGKEKIVTSW